MVRRVAPLVAGMLLLAVGLGACEEDSTPSVTPGADGGLPDSASTSDGSGPVGNDSAPPSSQRPKGTYLRFAHLAESRKDDRIDFCLRPKAEDEFTKPPVITQIGAPGLFYGEVGRFFPIEPGEYTYLAKDHPDCSGESIEGGDITIPSGVGSWALVTFALTLTSTGVIGVQVTDTEMRRSATEDRITVLDGTGDREATAPLPVSWVGTTSTVNLDVPNNSRSSTALLPAGTSGELRATVGLNPTAPFDTYAGRHGLAVIWAPNAIRICDHDEPIPTDSPLSPCAARPAQ